MVSTENGAIVVPGDPAGSTVISRLQENGVRSGTRFGTAIFQGDGISIGDSLDRSGLLAADTSDYSTAATDITVGVAFQGGSDSASVLVCVGTADAEGTSGDDLLVGRNRDDVIFGHRGNDTLDGSNRNGTDILFGGDGKGLLDGGNRDDQLNGGSGYDTLIGGSGAITSGALENSTVDIGTEFTNMIIAQRAYTASSKLVTTADEMLDDLVRIKR